MDCLSNLIGIKKGCTDDVPLSGLFVNDLPAMSLQIADSGANSENADGISLIRDRINFASNYLANDLRNFLQDKFTLNSVIENSVNGIYNENNSTIVATNKLRGIKIKVRESPYLNVNISRIGIRLTSTISTNIYVYNLYKNQLIATIPIEAIADELVYIDVNLKVPTKGQKLNLFVCMDASISDQYSATIDNSGTGCRTCSSKYYSSVVSGMLDGTLQKIEANFIASSSTGGLTLDYTIECDSDNYICSLGNSLAWSLLYKTGALIMYELINSTNYNSIVMIHKDNNMELMEYYEAEYSKSMNQLTMNLKLPNDICFNCKPKIRQEIQLP